LAAGMTCVGAVKVGTVGAVICGVGTRPGGGGASLVRRRSKEPCMGVAMGYLRK
jgi:hypothetical protein